MLYPRENVILPSWASYLTPAAWEKALLHTPQTLFSMLESEAVLEVTPTPTPTFHQEESEALQGQWLPEQITQDQTQDQEVSWTPGPPISALFSIPFSLPAVQVCVHQCV